MKNSRLRLCGMCSVSIAMSMCAAVAQTSWTHAGKAPTEIAPEMAYDIARRGLLCIGPGPSLGQSIETWLLKGGQWTQLQPANTPAARAQHAIATDWRRGRIVLFGGHRFIELRGRPVGTVDSETWEWDGVTWNRALPATIPTARQGASMAYDRQRGVAVLFGGLDGNGAYLGDTWEWNGRDWSMRAPSSSPSARYDHKLVYDNSRDRVFLVGGRGQNGPLGDLWAWDGGAWSLVSMNAIPPRNGHGMCFDERSGVIAVHGGSNLSGSRLDDFWEWNGSRWIQVVAPGPSARFGHGMAYDPSIGATVVFGGSAEEGPSSDTWIWGGGHWADLRTSAPPPAFGEAIGEALEGLLYFGGFTHGGMQDSTWTWDGLFWTRRNPQQRPLARYRHALAYDHRRGRTVLFGGSAGGGLMLRDTWEWDGGGWQRIQTGLSPLSRELHRMAFDSRRQRTLMFGGYNPRTGWRGDLWEWDGLTWTQKSSGPSPRMSHGMVYDESRGTTVVFGGRGEYGSLDDTWEWDGIVWQRKVPVNRPGPREQFVMVYDRDRGRAVLYGGENVDRSVVYQDVWEWDGVDWKQRLNAVGTPGSRVEASAAYDARGNKVLIHGGYVVSTQGTIASNTSMQTWHYGAINPASVLAYGAGCAGSVGVPHLLVVGLPWTGDSIRLVLSSLPSAGTAYFVLGKSNASWNGGVLPYDLTGIGMPGCFLLSSPDILAPVAIVGGEASLSIAVPNDATLVRSRVFVQGFASDRGINALGISASNGVQGTVGSR